MSTAANCSNGTDSVETVVKCVKTGTGSIYPPRDGHCSCCCGANVYVFGGLKQSSEDDFEETWNPIWYIDC